MPEAHAGRAQGWQGASLDGGDRASKHERSTPPRDLEVSHGDSEKAEDGVAHEQGRPSPTAAAVMALQHERLASVVVRDDRCRVK